MNKASNALTFSFIASKTIVIVVTDFTVNSNIVL